MPIRQECPTCKVTLNLPDSGVGRCPRCKSVVRAAARETPLEAPMEVPADALTPLIPEISEEHEIVGPEPSRPLEVHISPGGGPVPEPPPLPPPLPGPRRPGRPGRRRDLPEIDIANPLPKPSKRTPVILLTLALVASIGMVIGAFIYLLSTTRQRPVFFPGGR